MIGAEVVLIGSTAPHGRRLEAEESDYGQRERERETGEDCETRVAELLTTHVLFSIDGVESVDRTLKFRAPDRFPFQLLYIQFYFSFYFNFIFHLFSCPGKNRTVSEFYFLLHGSNKAREFYPQLA